MDKRDMEISGVIALLVVVIIILVVAAGMHRWATFAWVTRDDTGQWDIKIVFPSEDYRNE